MNAYLKESGYTDGLIPIDIKRDTKEVASFLRRTNLSYEQKPLYVSSHKIMEQTKAFFAEYFTLHDVYSLPGSRSIGFNGLIKSTGDFKRAMKTYCDLTSPFSIDLLLNYKDSNSFTEEESIYDNKNHVLSDVYFKAIVLASPLVNTSPCTYAHEIGHTQLDSRFGSITNYHNKEVISIFLEKLSALFYGAEVFYNMQRRRLQLLKRLLCEKFEEANANDATAYTISSLKAEALFNVYLSLDSEGQMQLIGLIQEVFDNKITVEDLLQTYNIDFNSSLDTSYMKGNLSI